MRSNVEGQNVIKKFIGRAVILVALVVFLMVLTVMNIIPRLSEVGKALGDYTEISGKISKDRESLESIPTVEDSVGAVLAGRTNSLDYTDTEAVINAIHEMPNSEIQRVAIVQFDGLNFVTSEAVLTVTEEVKSAKGLEFTLLCEDVQATSNYLNDLQLPITSMSVSFIDRVMLFQVKLGDW